MPYANGTKVPVAKSQHEIAYLLERAGADQVGTFKDTSRNIAGVLFQLDGLSVALQVPLPDPNDREFTHTPKADRRRSSESAFDVYEQEVKRRWRVVLQLVKMKLEAVELGLTTLQREFLADVRLPSGGTVEQHLAPLIAERYAQLGTPNLMPNIALPESTR